MDEHPQLAPLVPPTPIPPAAYNPDAVRKSLARIEWLAVWPVIVLGLSCLGFIYPRMAPAGFILAYHLLILVHQIILWSQAKQCPPWLPGFIRWSCPLVITLDVVVYSAVYLSVQYSFGPFGHIYFMLSDEFYLTIVPAAFAVHVAACIWLLVQINRPEVQNLPPESEERS